MNGKGSIGPAKRWLHRATLVGLATGCLLALAIGGVSLWLTFGRESSQWPWAIAAGMVAMVCGTSFWCGLRGKA